MTLSWQKTTFQEPILRYVDEWFGSLQKALLPSCVVFFVIYNFQDEDELFIISHLLNLFLQAICTEAGLMALRERRMKVTNEDFKKSKENVLYKKQEGTPEGLYL